MNIIELAKQAGLQTDEAGVWVDDGYIHDELEKFAALVEAAARADEREKCAKLCDVLAVHPEYASEITKLAAMAIRARRTT